MVRQIHIPAKQQGDLTVFPSLLPGSVFLPGLLLVPAFLARLLVPVPAFLARLPMASVFLVPVPARLPDPDFHCLRQRPRFSRQSNPFILTLSAASKHHGCHPCQNHQCSYFHIPDHLLLKPC